MESISRKNVKLQNAVNTEPLWSSRGISQYPIFSVTTEMDGFFQIEDVTCRVSGVPRWGYFIKYLKWKVTLLVACERWGWWQAGVRAGHRDCPQTWLCRPPELILSRGQPRRLKCRSPIFELYLWITEFISLWPGSEAAAWTSPVLWHSHRLNPVQVELQVLIYKTRRWGRGGTNTASSKEQNIGVSPNLCSVPLGTQSCQEGLVFQRLHKERPGALKSFTLFSRLVRIGWGFPRNISDNWSRWDWGSLRSWGSCSMLGLDWLPAVWKTHIVFSISWLETPDISKLALYHF